MLRYLCSKGTEKSIHQNVNSDIVRIVACCIFLFSSLYNAEFFKQFYDENTFPSNQKKMFLKKITSSAHSYLH